MIYRIHDTLKADYKVSLQRFIDNIPHQVIERNLLGPSGPLYIFNLVNFLNWLKLSLEKTNIE